MFSGGVTYMCCVCLPPCLAQGQGVLSDKLRSFSMQDLTLINADDELSLHASDGRMRRDPMDELSSGASTLPRAKSTAGGRQSKAGPTHAASCTRGITHLYERWHTMCSLFTGWKCHLGYL